MKPARRSSSIFLPNNGPPDIREVIFDDRWHPLDHRIGSARCRTFNPEAGHPIRTHWQYWWQYGPRPKVYFWVHRAVGCWWGRHRWETWWRDNRDGTSQRLVFCKYCPARGK